MNARRQAFVSFVFGCVLALAYHGGVAASSFPGGGGGGGGTTDAVRQLAKLAAPVTVASSSTETPFYSYTVPGGTLGTNGQIRLTFGFRINSTKATTPGTFDLALKYGGATTYLASAAPLTAGDDNVFFGFTVYLQAQGASSQYAYWAGSGSNSNYLQWFNGSGSSGLYTGSGNPLLDEWSVDSTANQTLQVTWKFSVSNASNSVTCKYATVELLP